MKLIFLLLFPTFLFSQTEIKLHLNSRNAKEVPEFDYYSKLKVSTLIDSAFELSVMANYERDNGINYYSYSASVNHNYFNTEYYKDTEIDIEYLSTSLLYPINKVLKTGYNIMITDTILHSININFKYKFIYIDLSFFDNIRKLKVSINPELTVKKVSIGLDMGLLYVIEKLKWNSGLTLKIKI